MNWSFLRASIFSEGFYELEAGSVAALEDKRYLQGTLLVNGHDIPGEKLEAFFADAGQTGYEANLNSYEKEMFEALSPVRRKYGKDYVVIAFSIQAVDDYRAITSHEGIHAQYFLKPRFRELVHDFWNGVMKGEQRQEVQGILSALGYNPDDPALMANECVAHILEYRGMEPGGRLAPLGKEIRRKLLLFFRSSRQEIIRLK